MFGGVGKAGWATLLASGVLLGGGISAQAADLGGDCCADLEERVAELEATTARKGNRKVSLEVYGWVNEAVMWWDDGTEQNVYVGTNTLEQTRFGFKGKAKINADWSAGYKIEIGLDDGGISGWNQDGLNHPSNSFKLRKSYWFIKSNKLGEVAVGQNGTSTYHTVDDADFLNTRNVSDFEAAAVYLGSFKSQNGAGPTWKSLLPGWNGSTPGQSSRKNIVQYNSPTFAGFSVSASWGEDDLWDVLGEYKGKVGAFKVKARVGYGESTDPSATKCGGPAADFKCDWFGAGATIQHEPTGLYVFGGYGWQQIDTPTFAVDDTSEAWLIQAGIEKKWNPLGTTTIFGEYRRDDAGGVSADGTVANATSLGANIDFWAAGIVQNIEPAAMDLYLMYRHAEGDFVNKASVSEDLGDFDAVIGGSRIQF
jgi:predicted porin